MTTRINARALWFIEPDPAADDDLFDSGHHGGDEPIWHARLCYFDLHGVTYVSNLEVAVRLDTLVDVPDLATQAGEVQHRVARQLEQHITADRGDHIDQPFVQRYVNAIESTGHRIRPISTGGQRIFGIFDPDVDWRLIGLITAATADTFAPRQAAA